MMKCVSKCAAVLFIVFVSVFFSSCAVSIELRACDDGSVSVTYNASFGNAFVELMRALAGGQNQPLFNTTEMMRQFHELGIETVRVSSSADTVLSVAATIPHNSRDVISQAGCIVRTKQSMKLVCAPLHFAQLYDSLPFALQSYIDLFMAPVFCGDALTKIEYLDLIASVYGKKLADEIAAANVKITMSGGTARQSYMVPLVELLTATAQSEYSIEW